MPIRCRRTPSPSCPVDGKIKLLHRNKDTQAAGEIVPASQHLDTTLSDHDLAVYQHLKGNVTLDITVQGRKDPLLDYHVWVRQFNLFGHCQIIRLEARCAAVLDRDSDTLPLGTEYGNGQKEPIMVTGIVLLRTDRRKER